MKLRSMLLAAGCLLWAANAQAVVNFVVTTTVTGGRPLNNVQVGDTITINIRTANPGAPTVFIAGIGAAVMQVNPTPANILTFVSGAVADTTLFCTNTACTNGLVSLFDSTTALTEETSVTVGRYVQFVNAIATTARNGDGSRDPGFDGINNGGDSMYRVVYTAAAEGTVQLDIGTTTDPGLGNVIVSSTAATGGTVTVGQGNNTLVNITVPEPAAAAAGMVGVALAGGLAAVRRRMIR